MRARALPPDHPRAIFADREEPDAAALRARAARLAPAAPAVQQPPDPGHVVADLARPDGSVLRVAVKRWRDPNNPRDPGAPFVDVRVWSGGWPVKGKGVAVKARELAALAVALLDAAEALAAEGSPR